IAKGSVLSRRASSDSDGEDESVADAVGAGAVPVCALPPIAVPTARATTIAAPTARIFQGKGREVVGGEMISLLVVLFVCVRSGDVSGEGTASPRPDHGEDEQQREH